MTQYRYEYGKRWDARVPRYAIAYAVANKHVGESDETIAYEIATRCTAPGYTPALIRQSVAYALECHRRNRELYRHVMRGTA